MKTYIAGKMGGLPQFGFPLFDAARDYLIGLGLNPVSPADMDRAIGFDEHADRMPAGFKQNAMKRDIEVILTCDAIALLPNWKDSDGARLERAVGEAIGLMILYLPEEIPC